MTSSLLTALAVVSGPMVEYTFRYEPTVPVAQVAVAGSFNQWNRRALIMKPTNGVWTATERLPMGRHQYKFVVDDNRWITDPANPSHVPDGAGNLNSEALVLPTDYAKPALVGDGVISQSVISSKRNFDQGRLVLSVNVRPGDVEKVSAFVHGKPILLQKSRTTEFFEQRSASIQWDKSKALSYYFTVEDAQTLVAVDADGTKSSGEPKPIHVSASNLAPIVVPSWVERSVFYQIFPDRFLNGDFRNDPAELANWAATPTFSNRFGGDAAGIAKNIPYLKGLGVNAIYLNPIMMATSNHRYDPVDFFTVDPEFATNQEFVSLTHELEAAGIRTVLDQIFDHVGVTFSPFADLLKYQQQSRYRDWFFVRSFPVAVKQNPSYEAWYGFESMPKLNVLHPAVKSYLFESVRYWMQSARLSGWRLDVANEVPSEFWREFRTQVKQIDPNAWIVGEVWTDATQWLSGDQWDASMNYPFRSACVAWIAKGQGSSADFLEALDANYALYAPQVSRSQMNLLSSHDTPRFLTEASGDVAKAKLAATVQFTWPGVPSVYYGEELGMQGGADPANRRGMEWNLVSESNPLLRHYTLLSALKTKVSVLATGAPEVLPNPNQPDVAVFLRRFRREVAAIGLNRGSHPTKVKIQIGTEARSRNFVDAISGDRLQADAQGSITVSIPPAESAILLEATKVNLEIINRGRTALPALIQKRNEHVQ